MHFFPLSPRKWRQSPPHSPVSLRWILTVCLPEIRSTLFSALRSQRLLLSSRLPLSCPQGHCSCNHHFSLILWIHLSLLDYSHHCMGMPKSGFILRKEKKICMRPCDFQLFLQASILSTEVLKGLSVSISSLPITSSSQASYAFSLLSQDYPYSTWSNSVINSHLLSYLIY